jgi:hypothetical protein
MSPHFTLLEASPFVIWKKQPSSTLWACGNRAFCDFQALWAAFPQGFTPASLPPVLAATDD